MVIIPTGSWQIESFADRREFESSCNSSFNPVRKVCVVVSSSSKNSEERTELELLGAAEVMCACVRRSRRNRERKEEESEDEHGDRCYWGWRSDGACEWEGRSERERGKKWARERDGVSDGPRILPTNYTKVLLGLTGFSQLNYTKAFWARKKKKNLCTN